MEPEGGFPQGTWPGTEQSEVRPIRRVRYEALTFATFIRAFRSADRPLIIDGIPPDQSPCFGGAFDPPGGAGSGGDPMEDPLLDVLSRQCLETINVERSTDKPGVRKGMSQVGKLPLSAFLNAFWELGGQSFEHMPYFGDVRPVFASMSNSLRKACSSEVWRRLRFPAYFTGELLARDIARDEVYPEDDIYPSLYFSQRGLRQLAHVDVPRTELWSAACRGKKWYQITPMSVALRYPPVPGAKDWTRPNLPVWRGVLGPGEVLFIPAGAVHAIWTEEDTINIIDNMIDLGNLGPPSPMNIELLRRAGPSDAASRALLAKLASEEQGGERLPVFDGRGVVTNASSVPRGFPSWGDLSGWVAGGQPLVHCFNEEMTVDRCCVVPIDWSSCWNWPWTPGRDRDSNGIRHRDLAGSCCGWDRDGPADAAAAAARGGRAGALAAASRRVRAVKEDLEDMERVATAAAAAGVRLSPAADEVDRTRRLLAAYPQRPPLAFLKCFDGDNNPQRCCLPNPHIDWRRCWLRTHMPRVKRAEALRPGQELFEDDIMWHASTVQACCQDFLAAGDKARELLRAEARAKDLEIFLSGASMAPPRPAPREALVYTYPKVGTTALEHALRAAALAMLQTHRHDTAAELLGALRAPCTVVASARDPRDRSPSEFFDQYVMASPFSADDFSGRDLGLLSMVGVGSQGEDWAWDSDTGPYGRERAHWRSRAEIEAEPDIQAALRKAFATKLPAVAGTPYMRDFFTRLFKTLGVDWLAPAALAAVGSDDLEAPHLFLPAGSGGGDGGGGGGPKCDVLVLSFESIGAWPGILRRRGFPDLSDALIAKKPNSKGQTWMSALYKRFKATLEYTDEELALICAQDTLCLPFFAGAGGLRERCRASLGPSALHEACRPAGGGAGA